VNIRDLFCQPIFFVKAMLCYYIYVNQNHIIMQLAERDFIVGGHKIGTIPFYTDIDPILEAHKPGTRVLPAAFFYERGGHFELIKRHEPGEYSLMPEGGFEVSADGGSRRYYDLNQVIVHPTVAKHRQALDLMERKEEKDERARVRDVERNSRPKVEGGRRGRPAMDPAVKAQLEADKASRASVSGGKRGRPKSTSTAPKTPKTSGGKRGRKPLDPSIREARAREAVIRTAKSGGKRGRPKRG
jgi:hypothetical protein